MPGQGLMTPLVRLHDWLTDMGFHLGKLCLGIIIFAYSFEVVSRYFFNAPTWWADEAVSYSLCIGCFLMMPYVTRQRGHVAVTFLIDVLRPSRRHVSYVAIYVVCFVVCGAAFWINLDENIRQVVQDVYIMKVKSFPKIYISVFITFGFGMSAIHFLRMAISGDTPVQGSGGGSFE